MEISHTTQGGVTFPDSVVASVQMEPRIGKKTENVAHSIGLMEEAAVHGATLVVLPELANTGYVFASRAEAFALALVKESVFDERFNEIEPIFPVFKTRLKQYAGTLSGGEQKMLLVARSLMMRPSIILLDEITEGLQPSVIDRLAQALLWERNHHGTTILLIEQNVPFALKVTDRYLVLKQGEIIDQGKAKDEGATASIFEHLKV